MLIVLYVLSFQGSDVCRFGKASLLVLVEAGRLTVLFTGSKFSFARLRDVWSKVVRDNVEKSILSCIVAQIPEVFSLAPGETEAAR